MFGKTDQVIEELVNYMDEKIDSAVANSLASHIGIYQELMEDERKLMEQTAREIKNDLLFIPAELQIIKSSLERYSDIPNQVEQLSRTILDYEKEIQRLKAIVQRKDKQLKRLKNAV